MKTWQALYAMVWISFFAFLTILFPFLGWQIAQGIHIVVGVVVIVMAFYNRSLLEKSQAPLRLKRIATATANISVAQAIIGLLFLVDALAFLFGLFEFIHIVNAVAIVTQTSSTATAYDMWEEKEYEPKPTAPAS